MRRIAVLLVLALLAGQAAAQPAFPPGFEAAQTAFTALPADERRAIQNALVWTGDFSGIATGEFGRLTYTAITTFQRRQGMQRPDAVLTREQRAALEREANRFRSVARFEVVTDPRTGVRIGIPTALVRPRVNAGNGSRWASRDQRVVIETLMNPGGERELPTLFEAFAQRPDHQTTYRLSRPDFFVLSGQLGTDRRFYTRMAQRGDDLVGYNVVWATAVRDLDRINVAIANAFARGTVETPVTTIRAPAEPSEPRIARPSPAPDGTAVIVARGRALAPASSVEGCRAVLVGGRAVRVERVASDLAVLSLATDTVPLAPGASPEPDAPLLFLGQGADGLSFAPATASRGPDGELAPVLPLQAGQQGGALLDRSGRLVAVVLGPQRVRTVAIGGVTPAQAQRVVEGEALADLIGTDASGPAEPRPTADIVLSAQGAVQPVSCRR